MNPAIELLEVSKRLSAYVLACSIPATLDCDALKLREMPQKAYVWAEREEEKARKSLDAIVVLGAGRAGFVSCSRERIAGNYVKNNGKMLVIASGGRGLLCDRQEKTEAEGIWEGLLSLGVNPEMIQIEPYSRTTKENLANSAFLAFYKTGNRNLKIGIVTSSGHMARALRYGKEARGKVKFNVDFFPVYRREFSLKDVLSEFCVLAYEGMRGIYKFFER